MNKCSPAVPHPEAITSIDQPTLSYMHLQLVVSHPISNFQSQALRDCYCLGQFNSLHSKPRPVLAKFIRVADVCLVLSKKGRLKSPYFMRLDMTCEQRLKEYIYTLYTWSGCWLCFQKCCRAQSLVR